MTEGTNWFGPEGEGTRQRQLAEKRARWERGREMEREAERVSGLRQEMDSHRNKRLADWMDHGGTPEQFQSVWPAMMKDFLDGKQAVRDAARDAERSAKLEEAERSIFG